MKPIFILIALCSLSNIATSQTKALTESGKEVVLYDNGTWKYSADNSEDNTSRDSIGFNTKTFTKGSKSTFLVKSKKVTMGLYVNPAKWAFNAGKDNDVATEYTFSHKSTEVYATMLTERTEIVLSTMRELALTNAQRASIDVKETLAEYRMVNGIKVLCLQFNGTIKGMRFCYMAYYFSNSSGTTQLISFCSESKFEAQKDEMESFLNGLVELQK